MAFDKGNHVGSHFPRQGFLLRIGSHHLAGAWRPTRRPDDDHRLGLALLNQIVEDVIRPTGSGPGSLGVAAPVHQIQHRVPSTAFVVARGAFGMNSVLAPPVAGMMMVKGAVTVTVADAPPEQTVQPTSLLLLVVRLTEHACALAGACIGQRPARAKMGRVAPRFPDAAVRCSTNLLGATFRTFPPQGR